MKNNTIWFFIRKYSFVVRYACFIFSNQSLICPQPCPFMPNTFQRSLLVTLQPPFTETDLQQEEHKPDYQTKRIATVRSEIQSEREINDSTGNRLSDIIAQTHFSIKAKIGYKLLEAFLLIKQHKLLN